MRAAARQVKLRARRRPRALLPRRRTLKLAAKVAGEYSMVKDLPPPGTGAGPGSAITKLLTSGSSNSAGAGAPAAQASGLMLKGPGGGSSSGSGAASAGGGVVAQSSGAGSSDAVPPGGTRLVPRRRDARSDMPRPEWHAPWKLMRVVSGHMGWVRCIAIDPTNSWYATGSADRTIKIWDLASGTLKLTLTGHISTIRGLAVSDRSPYLFSAGEDKMVRCWDLEYNRVIRDYHGHLSGVYCLAMHPTLDLLMTGGRDSVVRVWDIRTKNAVHTLTGHNQTVVGLGTQALEPQVISGSMDSTIRCWDLVAGRASAVLTNHKKAVRSILVHPTEYTFASASPDHIKKWKSPEGKFLQNIAGHNSIINCLAINQDNVSRAHKQRASPALIRALLTCPLPVTGATTLHPASHATAPLLQRKRALLQRRALLSPHRPLAGACGRRRQRQAPLLRLEDGLQLPDARDGGAARLAREREGHLLRGLRPLWLAAHHRRGGQDGQDLEGGPHGDRGDAPRYLGAAQGQEALLRLRGAEALLWGLAPRALREVVVRGLWSRLPRRRQRLVRPLRASSILSRPSAAWRGAQRGRVSCSGSGERVGCLLSAVVRAWRGHAGHGSCR